MKVTVIIPARWGSERLGGKPLVDIAGRPMVRWVAERCAAAPEVDQVVVATDDERIVAAVEAFGGRAVMTPADLRSGSDRVGAAAELLGLGEFDIVVNVQGDQPLVPPELISQTAAPLLADETLGMTTPVTLFKGEDELKDPTNVKTVMTSEDFALYFSRASIPYPRGGEKIEYHKHLGVYAFRVWFLRRFCSLPTGRLESVERLEQLRVLEAGLPIKCVLTDLDSPEVDTAAHARQVALRLQAASKETWL
jgi:3-deoxy-manno-octulosonate cytidylyltransferase (CMP-KDO synthetase)